MGFALSPVWHARTVTVLIWASACVLVAIGLAGILLPALPGTILIFLGLLLAAWADHFTKVGAGTLVLIGVLAAASYAVDFVAAALGARHVGASPRAIAGAALGSIAGLFLGLPGLILGPLAGAIAGEWSANRDVARAGRVGVAAWIGFVLGMGVKFALAIAMIGIFIAAMLW